MAGLPWPLSLSRTGADFEKASKSSGGSEHATRVLGGMTILILSDFFPHKYRSHEGIFVWEQARELAKRHQVLVVAPRVWYPPLKRYRELRFPVSKIPFSEKKEGVLVLRPVYRTIPVVGEWLVPYWFLLKILFLFSWYSIQFDLIHAHWAYRAGWWGVLLGRFCAKPVVVTSHGSDIFFWANERFKKGRIRWALHHAAAVIFVSRKLAQKARALKIQVKNPHIFLNAIARDKFLPLEKQPPSHFAEKNILFVGNLVPAKGGDRFLEALALLPAGKNRWRATLVGDGLERKFLKEKSLALGLETRLKFAGRLTNLEVLRQIQQADVLVIPSRYEGGPVVLLEALALGKTVVAFDVGIVRDVLSAPNLGFVVAEQTPRALAAGIEKALEAPVSPERARRRAEDFLLCNLVQKLDALYRELTD